MAAPTTSVVSRPQESDGPAWWRTVLGEYPTGVAIVTSVDSERRPVGMVVGSFNPVSDEPPLIGFLPATSSRTWVQIQEAGRFRVSVLGTQHEDLCREFARDSSTRFASGSWSYDETGAPVLTDALTWFDATLHDVSPAGDHVFVTGLVTGFGVGDGAAGLPLLYLKGSYGSFSIPRLEFDLHEFGGQLRMADQLRDVIALLAADLGVDCILTSVVRDSVVVLASADGPGRVGELVGVSFPFAAPIAPVFAAWSGSDRATVWLENSRHLLGAVDRPLLADLLERVRDQGYAVSIGAAMAEHFDQIISRPDLNRAHLSALWRGIHEDYERLRSQQDWRRHVSSIQVPVFGSDATAQLELVVSGFAPCDDTRFDTVLARTLRASEELTAVLSGRTGPERTPEEGTS
jgi:flavin reductase (DIM6/NTAB) family NADH-FMN oxidoreductase RutF/DNA-binding IclR family transcriptional regulator